MTTELFEILFPFSVFIQLIVNAIVVLHLLKQQYHLGEKYGFSPKVYRRRDFLFRDDTVEFARWNFAFAKEYDKLKNRFFSYIGLFAGIFVPINLIFIAMLI